MSTKSTIAHGIEWKLYEEMIEETTWIAVARGPYLVTPEGVRVQLPPDLIDAIRSAPDSAFPHLRFPARQCEEDAE